MASLCKNLRLARQGANYISHRLGAVRTFSSNSPLLKTRPLLQVQSQSPSKARFLGPRAFSSVAQQTGDGEPDVLKESNKAPPAGKLFQVDSFSRLAECEVEKCELGKFEAGGYKWSLTIHPVFGEEDDDDHEMLVRLGLADTSALPEGWEVEAVFSVCMKNQNNGEHYQSCFARAHFDATETECDAFIPTHLLNDPEYGFVKNDTCVFGAEVFVNKKDVVTEVVSLKNFKPLPYKQEFKIPNFPSLNEEGGWFTHQTWTSPVFSAGGHLWKLKVSPRGWEEGKGRLSIFLEKLADSDSDDDDSDDDDHSDSDGDSSDDDSSKKPSNTNASYSITLKTIYGSTEHVKYTCTGGFSESGGYHRGWHSFIDLVTLNDPDKGFVEDGCVTLELELSVDEDGSTPA